MAEIDIELVKKLIDLTSQLALTNQSLAGVGEEVKLHNKLLYGDGAENGGLLVRANSNREMIEAHTKILESLEKSCGDVVRFMVAQAETNKSQSDTVASLNRAVRGIAIVITIILILSGILGWRDIYVLLQTIPHP